MGLWIGKWEDVYLGEQAVWLRFYDAKGSLVLLPAEAERMRAESERVRAEAERVRVERAEAELARLKARPQALGAEIED